MTRHRKLVARRAFLAGAAAVGGLAPLAMGVGRSRAAGPAKGGHLRLGVDGAGTTDSLDPASYASDYGFIKGFIWGNCLVEIDEHGKPVPELAASWQPNADATRWVFSLRKGVLFHNGKEMTAADVVHSIDHHRGPNSKSGALAVLKPVTEVKASGKHEVTFTLAAGNADLPALLSDYHLLIMPEGGDPAAGIGTGPFVLDRVNPGVVITGKRNPGYWKPGRPYVDTVELIAINDPTARMSALQTRAVDAINRVDPKIVGMLKAKGGVKVLDVPSAGFYCFPMRCDLRPFDNADLRMALKLALDREDMLKKILRGFGRLGNDQPVPSFDPMFDAGLAQRTYDPDKARSLFKKSGWNAPIELQVAPTSFPGALDAAALYQQSAKKAGIDIAIRRVSDDGYWDNVWLKAPFCGSYWSGRATADQMLSTGFLSDAAWNETAWRRPEFDRLVVAARGELDMAKRRAMYATMQTMIRDDGGDVIPVFNNAIFALGGNIGGFVPTPVLTGARMPEQLYFES